MSTGSKFLIVTCQDCSDEIVLHWSTPLRTFPRRELLPTGVLYIDVACHRCGHGYRYTADNVHERLYDTADPDQLPGQKVWLGSWLRCDGESCDSHVLVESAMPVGSTSNDVKQFFSRCTLHGITCYSGHAPALPLELMWDSISDSEILDIPPESFLLHSAAGGALRALASYGLGVAKFRLVDGRKLNRIDNRTFQILETGEKVSWRP